MTGLRVNAPLPGRLIPLAQVPDPVFAAAMLGPGVAIDPGTAARSNVLAPIDGVVAALHPHAVVLTPAALGEQADSQGVLVHLGIDTTRLRGAGFDLLVAQGATVSTGQPLIAWSPAAVTTAGFSPIVPVIALSADSADLTIRSATEVRAGDPIFDWR
ncbi:MAG: PTS glucose transporter subunit IIA [Beutenbergiaceae bacterium]